MNYELFNAIHSLSHHSNILDSFMIFVTEKAIYLYALMLLAIWLFGGSSYKKSVLQAGFTGILGLAANYLITLIYSEPRPFVS
ncbi:undecaprenyl-diphosphatase, partial [Klebsiella pneumoniae]|nr:undecaprenyl-diphosphatase [Klebsiella pneumoniae]